MSSFRVLGSFRAVLAGRLGDFILVIVFGGYLIFLSSSLLSICVLFMLCFVSFTKSAQYPFMSWLPSAIAAPTPVSALVHSRTLVTAGILLLLFYSNVVFIGYIGWVLVIVNVISLFFVGLLALLERDFKKLVALSTLRQLSLCMLCISFCSNDIAFIHIVIHAFFKSLLFIQVGYVIYTSCGQQGLSSVTIVVNWFSYSVLLVCLLRLCGLIYTCGMLSKECLVSIVLHRNVSILIFSVLLLSVVFTYYYSLRLFSVLFSSSSSSYSLKVSISYCIASLIVLLVTCCSIL